MTTRSEAVTALISTFGDPADLPASAEALATATALLAQLEGEGATACDGLRKLLDGPPRPVLDLGSPAGGAVGAKLLALLFLAQRGERRDAARFERLAEDHDEPLPVRLAAARAWFDSDPADTAAELINLLVGEFPIEPDTAEEILAPFRDVIATLIPPLVGHLYHRLMNHRLRARRLLVAAGPHAVDQLQQVVETTEDGFARADAAAALAELDRSSLNRATAHLHLPLSELLKTDDRRNIFGTGSVG